MASALAGAGISGEVAGRLTAFGVALLERNRVLNLTAARTPAAVAGHIADSLTLVPFVRGPLVDIGSGGGFPAIPLAVACAIPVTMVESAAKKARFLREVAGELGLPSRVETARAEVAAHDGEFRGRFSTATARALGPVTTVAELTLPFLELGGVALLQRGTFDAVESAAIHDALRMLGGELIDVLPVSGAFSKHILRIGKRAPTPVRFPRRAGIPEKRPLCWSR